jgi:2-succinyl-5-enolpyruvyl-6-hydroxy-3-cyclohexene-1-carboxylate synthase
MEGEPKGNEAVLRALFGELDGLGVREFCVAAGARNAPIIAVLMEEGSGCVVRHFFEERSAAFFALGRIMADRVPVAVVTTSGTAVGEMLPAMMEAHYQGLPLVAITADRPSRYRGSGAPQAVEQSGIFGEYVTRAWEGEGNSNGGLDFVDSTFGQGGPIHFNVCLEEEDQILGVIGEGADHTTSISELPGPFGAKETWKTFQQAEGAGVVLVSGLHPADVPMVQEFLLRLGWPVVAEATSNLLCDKELETLLTSGGEKALQMLDPKRVLRIGAVPSWRWWRDLEEREDITVMNLCRTSFRGLARTVNVETDTLDNLKTFEVGPPTAILSKLDVEIGLGKKLAALLDQFPHSEPAWLRHLSRLIPAGATVFLGNSLPIREWNLAAVKPKPGTRFFANRGANGIDGLLSTGFGVGADASEAWIVLGDLSALYDMNAPWILPQLKNQRWCIVVINNGGGKIFSRVKWLRGLPEATQRIVENRHALNFEHWAKQWNLEYRRFEDAATLRDDDVSAVVWEIIPDAEQTEAFWAEWK